MLAHVVALVGVGRLNHQLPLAGLGPSLSFAGLVLALTLLAAEAAAREVSLTLVAAPLAAVATAIAATIGLDPVQPTDDGLSLVPYAGSDAGDLTVGGELNKIAANVALGRDTAGVHWRSDANESLKLGEQIAISILKDQRACYNEVFNGFSLTKFDGTTITV